MTIDTKIPVWLDCDPGNDDAFAILLLLFHPRFNLLGISTVHGNAPLSATTHNALGLLEVLHCKQDHPKVYPGSEIPLKGEAVHALNIHGASGIGGVQLPLHPRIKISKDVSYLEAMRSAILKYPHDICIICTGTLTNFAKLIIMYPELKPKIKFLSIMGGALNTGNITPYAEFNIFCDPFASQLVLTDEIISPKTIMAPLNITHKAIATSAVRSKVFKPSVKSSDITNFFHSIVEFYGNVYAKNYGQKEGPPIHDPVAAFSLLPFIDDDFEGYGYKFLRRKLQVVQKGEHIGEILVENNNFDPSVQEEDGVYVGVDLDVDFFWDNMKEALTNAERHISKEH